MAKWPKRPRNIVHEAPKETAGAKEDPAPEAKKKAPAKKKDKA